jgi:GTP:adenosylcobinamide-phosphate guanylyltransferase
MKNNTFNAVVLAGDRGPSDPLVQAARVSAKALVTVGGRAMILRVLDVLLASPRVGQILVVGPNEAAREECTELNALIDAGKVHWLAPEQGPSASAERGLEYFSAQNTAENANVPTLITTADHALLTQAVVEDFLLEAEHLKGADVVAAMVEKEAAEAALPGSRRTGLKFSDGIYCGCNLFAVMTSKGRRAISFWRKIEHLRKKPVKLLGAIGWRQALFFRLGRLSLPEALQHLGSKTSCRARIAHLSHPLAAADVDSAQDWKLAGRYLRENPNHGNEQAQAIS